MIEPTLLAMSEAFLDSSLRPVQALEGGDEAQVFRLDGESGSVVLHVGPPWRTRAELEWVHAVVERVHEHVPRAVPPIRRRGETVLEWEGRCVTLFPFVEGAMLDREDPNLRAQAARILAAIHAALQGWSGGPRPDSALTRPTLPLGPAELRDDALDRWWESVGAGGFVTAATHGDYYRRNVLCRDGQIAGVIDWHDATVRPLVLELAGATFEFCRNDDHVLQLDRVRDFVRAYGAAGGPIPDHELEMLLPFMRWWVRNDVRGSLACSGGAHSTYVKKQVKAFTALAHVRFIL